MKLEIRQSEDGSKTLFNNELNEHYHSIHGAKQESRYVFLEMGLSKCIKDEIVVFEVGFGTGLNAYLAALYAIKNNKHIIYTSVEAFPLPDSITSKLDYMDTEKEKKLFEKICNCPWNIPSKLNENFTLSKIHSDFTELDIILKNEVDIIFFDAFSPEVQPEMWEQEIFDFLFKLTANNGIITTYCAKGVVRRRMMSAGYHVERLPGPPGKREMLRGTKKVETF